LQRLGKQIPHPWMQKRLFQRHYSRGRLCGHQFTPLLTEFPLTRWPRLGGGDGVGAEER
jgi:hypothetical protein